MNEGKFTTKSESLKTHSVYLFVDMTLKTLEKQETAVL